jgi:hypothetical protein
MTRLSSGRQVRVAGRELKSDSAGVLPQALLHPQLSPASSTGVRR